MVIWQVVHRITIVLVVVLIGAMLAVRFVPKFQERQKLQATKIERQEENRRKAELYKSLQAKRERLQHDPRFVERIAREELGYAKPGEVIFRFEEEE